ncbi:hypothetical protein [Paraburkholderia fungorum]|uniref:hypothetical protein n=1 Tax=Paraburkholderia fungorum TaxID=134537 RepID=UPI0038BC6D53
MEASWVLLGVAILAAILVLATLINTLDSAGANPAKAFKAGDNRIRQLSTMGTFIIFGLGMLCLGGFAARNYDNVVHRKPEDFAVSSATMAIEAAKKATADTQTVKRIASVDLIPGTGGSGSSSAVWHVVLETRGAPPPAISSASAPGAANPVRPRPRGARPADARKQPISSNTPRAEVVDTSAAAQRVDCYIDAKTGAVTAQP